MLLRGCLLQNVVNLITRSLKGGVIVSDAKESLEGLLSFICVSPGSSASSRLSCEEAELTRCINGTVRVGVKSGEGGGRKEDEKRK